MKHVILIALLGTIAIPVLSQSKKDIKKHKIKVIQEYVTETRNGQSIKYLDSRKEYDKNGCLITDIEYRKNGSVKKKETHKYNGDKDKTESMIYDSTGFVHRVVYSYNAEGDKSKELFYDEKNTLLKEVTYQYDSKELKTERRSVNNKKVLESVRNWVYEFYK